MPVNGLLVACARYRSLADRVRSRTEQGSGAASEAVESGMTYITGHDRSQLLLLPEAVDDYVGSDNPVRFHDGSLSAALELDRHQ